MFDLRQKLDAKKVRLEDFQAINALLISKGFLSRRDGVRHSILYDVAKRCEDELQEAFGVIYGAELVHDSRTLHYRLLPFGDRGDGLPDPGEDMEIRRELSSGVNKDFVAALLTLKILFNEQVADRKIEADGRVSIRATEFATALKVNFKTELPPDKKIERDELDRRRQSFAAGRAHYPQEVSAFVDYLKEVLPESRPRILCDVVEMRDPAWQNAVEGFIAADRFAILYDEAYESRVIALHQRYKSQGTRRVSVAQIAQVMKEAASARPGSLVDKIKSADPIAIGYLKGRYGRSMCVSDRDELRSIRSGLLVDGYSVHAFSYRDRSVGDDELIFGIEVRRQQATRIVQKLAVLQDEIQKSSSVLDALRRAATGLAHARPVDVGGLQAQALAEAGARVRSAELQKEGLDLSSIAGLEEQRDEEEERVKEIDGLRAVFNQQIGTLNTEFQRQTTVIAEQDIQIAKLEPIAVRAEADFQIALPIMGDIKKGTYEREFRTELATDRQVSSFEERRADRRLDVSKSLDDFKGLLREYNASALDHQKIIMHPMNYPGMTPSPGPMAEWFGAMEETVYQQLRRQRGFRLGEVNQELQMAEINFTSAFTSNFCQRILGKVGGRDATIEQVNQTLKDISFSGDEIKITSEPNPEFDAYVTLFRAIQEKNERERSDDAETLDLFSSDQFDEENTKTLMQLRELLLSNDADRSLEELDRIADYRNYKKYDFAKRTKAGEWIQLSTWGHGSGGESETAFYVIRAAVFAGAFKLYSRQNCAHFRTMFLDEVFTKMDESRTRLVMDFLSKQNLNLQLVVSAASKTTAAVLDCFSKRIGFAKAFEAGGVTYVYEADLDQEKVREIYDRHRQATIADTTVRFDRGELAITAGVDLEAAE